MNIPSVRVVHGKDGIPIMVRDEEPFFVDRWRDEIGNEYVNEYRLVFDFREGLLVEITQRLEGSIGGISWEVTPNRLDLESLMWLMGSGSLERIRAKVKEVVQSMTANFMTTLDHLAETNSRSSERLGAGPVTSVNLTLFMNASGATRTFATGMRSSPRPNTWSL
jgi:hypothetical protein